MKHYAEIDNWVWLWQSVILQAVKDYIKAKNTLIEAENGKEITRHKILVMQGIKKDCERFFRSQFFRDNTENIDVDKFIEKIEKLSDSFIDKKIRINQDLII